MERTRSSKEKGTKGLIVKTIERCRSFGRAKPGRGPEPKSPKSGCVAVYVGPDKERVVIRTECVNHPLFRALLDEAEREYGYAREGPIELPCDVEEFERVMWAVGEELEDEAVSAPRCGIPPSPGRGFGKAHAGYRILSPSSSRFVIADRC